MMGLGYLGSSSSSSSSSNLSPLAPPFTVDRSNHNKPIVNSNPVSHFNDPSYGVPFSSSWPYSHPSTARQDFLGDSLSTATAPSNDCMYTIPEPINPPITRNWSGLNSNVKPGTHWSAVNPSPKPVTDSYSFNVSEAKPFYPPYASPVNNDDIPLVTLSKPGYDLLSTSGLVLGDESSQVDYTQSLSGLEYNPQREGIWSGPPEGKHGKKMESDDSFFSEEANIAASLAYKDYFKQGAYGTETLSKGEEDSSMFYHAADIIRRENNIGPSFNGKADVTSFSVNNHRLNPNEFSKGGPIPPFRAFPMFSESHPLVPSPEPPEEPWNAQNSYTLYEKRFHLFDSSDDRMSPSITKSSPSLVIKPPKSMEVGNVAALNINGVVGGHKPLKEKEGLESNGSFLPPNQLSFQIGRTDQHAFVAPSSSKEDMSTNLSVSGGLNFEFKARSSFQVPDINIPNVKTSAANSFEHFDHHNPAEDSPCWKGAPTSHFLPFEATSPQHPTKKLQTDHSFNHSSKVYEMSKSKESIEKEHSGEAQSVHDDTIKPRKEHGFLDESTSDANSQTSQLKLPNFKEDADHSIRAVERVSVFSVEDAANLATAKKVNTSSLVKALHNLSDLLLVRCSNDEYAPKEQDQKALDHVIANLNVCMSRKVQVASTNKLMLPLQDTSNMSQEVTNDTSIFHDNEADYQKLNSDNVEKLMECASQRNEADPPKVDKMVQAIKKVLDEHLECKEELPSETLLYKNLWLEAEAELCSLSYKARFERMKREVKKGEASESSVPTKKSSSRSGSPFDLKIPPKLIDKADDSQVSNTHVQNHLLSGSLSGIGDVEASVMARFNILKRRGESNLVTDQGQEVAIVKVCGKGSEGSVQHDVTKGENVEPLVMARLNILKCRGEPNAVDVEEKRVADGEENESLSGKAAHFLHGANKEEAGWYLGSGSDWEHILKDEFSWQSNGRPS